MYKSEKASQHRMPIVDALKSYIKSDRLSMHVPGHKGISGTSEYDVLSEIAGENAVAADITEIAEFDDFHNPEGIIKEAQMLAAELYGADETFFLVNGSTSGIMAATAAVTGSCGKIIVARDCHKSVIRGLVISGGNPVYVNPVIDNESGIPAGLSVESVRKAFRDHPDAGGIVISNPSYYGTYSDIREIAGIAHSYGAAVIADEAHGGHLQFYCGKEEGICPALHAGADVSIQSTHKMNGSMTQSSMLHVRGDIIDREKLRFYIRLLTSTSPSYILMASLDASRYRMAFEGEKLWKHVREITVSAAERIDSVPGINVVRRFGGGCSIEECRLLFSAKECGLSGGRLADILFKEYGIDVEFSDDVYCLAVMGINTSESDLLRLEEALRKISEVYYTGDAGCGLSYGRYDVLMEFNQVMTPRMAVLSDEEWVRIEDCQNRISAHEIAVYPPGIPCVQPGEEISCRIRDYILEEIRRDTHMHGIEHEVSDGGDVWLAAVVKSK